MLAHSCKFPQPTLLPQLQTLPPPTKILDICKRSPQRLAHPPQQLQIGLQVIAEQDYKKLYQQKCQELIQCISKGKDQEAVIAHLRSVNSDLEFQIKRLQEERWNGSDYTRLSARLRSKSQRRLVPTIEVKVPSQLRDQHCVYTDQDPYVKTERQEFGDEIEMYKKEIQIYKSQLRQLKQEIKKLQQKLFLSQKNSKVNSIPINYHHNYDKKPQNNSNSPQKFQKSFRQLQKLKTPLVTQFSPNITQQTDTIRKDKNFAQGVELQIKRLKNQLLYKDLLITKLAQQKQKQNGILQKHLKLSVQQSKKIADQTSQILNNYKIQIVTLWKQLQSERLKNIKLQEYFQKHHIAYSVKQSQFNPPPPIQHQQINDMLSLLKSRRTERLD